MLIHHLLWIVGLLCLVVSGGDLNLDKQALLDFSSAVPHGRKLNWDPFSGVCSNWVGVICSSDGGRVVGLRLPGIGLAGPIPINTLGRMDSLAVLSLRSNRLDGDLPSDVLSIPSLRYLFLQDNGFSGGIPSELPPGIVVLDLSFNSLTGGIPSSVRNLTRLTTLSLQNNSLSGSLPDIDLPRLRRFNVSFNHLNGTIPPFLQSFPNSSFLGNPLCGLPLSPCFQVPSPSAPPPPHSPRKFPMWAIIAIAAGGGAFLLLLSALVLFLLCCKNKQKRDGETTTAVKVKSSTSGGGGRTEKPSEEFGSGVQASEKNKLVFFEGCSYNFDLEDLLRASAEVLGKGSFGTAYKAVLEESTTVVVKRLKEVVVGKKDFDQQMEIISRVGHHQNVVPLRAYYYSKDEKLLVYDYHPNGSLSNRLHGHKNGGKSSSPLDWDSRLKIALGSAKALAHLQSTGGSRFSHGNVKSSNIILNQEMEPCVSDFGLAPLMNYPPPSA
ncbi:hypothetical protein M569_16602, partial [Genlisea aurea]